MEKPVVQKQPSGKDTVIFQVGKSGINLGRVDFTLKAGRVTAWAGYLLDLTRRIVRLSNTTFSCSVSEYRL